MSEQTESVDPVAQPTEAVAQAEQNKQHKEKKTKETKREIPPGRPVKPSSNFNLFKHSIDEKEIEKELGQASKELAKRSTFFSNRWKNLSAEERAKWTDKYNELNKKYKTDLEDWYKQNPGQKELEEAEAVAKKQKKKDDKEGGKPIKDEEKPTEDVTEAKIEEPKQNTVVYPQGPLILFIMAHFKKVHEEFGSLPVYNKNLSTLLYDKWHGLDDSNRGNWTKLFNELDEKVKTEIINQYERWEKSTTKKN